MARDMRIFQSEVDAGLSEQLTAKASRTIAYCSQVKALNITEIDDIPEALTKMRSIATNLNQVDLYYFDSILVSTGLNKNLDFFDREEVWAAKSTPEDKAINFEHEESEIIGHITASYPVDENLALIPTNLSLDTIPNKLHIITGGVLYTHWDDEKKQERIDNIIKDIAKGTIYVSMEALFSDFDYVLEETQGNYSIVDRNSDTSFLTKFLRCYGGSGVYKDKTIGRVLRYITFSGKGIVRNPANPESIIFNDMLPLINKVQSKLIIGEHKTMADKLTEGTVLEARVGYGDVELRDELKAVKASLEAEKVARQEAKAQADAEAKARAAQEVADLKTSVATKTGELNVANERIAKLEAEAKAAVDKLAAAEAESKVVADELAKIKTEAKKALRVAALEKAGHDNAKAVALEASFATLSDEAFTGILDVVKVANTDETSNDEELAAVEAAKAAAKNADTKKDGVDLSLPGGTAKASELFKALEDGFRSRLKTTAKNAK